MQQTHFPDPAQNRQERYTSHALVELRRFKILPFFAISGVLLDLSLSGFKLDFTTDVNVKPGAQFWLHIPLSTLGIFAPTSLSCQIECRWFDPKKNRMGGVFLDLSRTDRLVIDQIIMTLQEKERSAG